VVTDDSQLVGVVSFSDLERAIMEGKGELPVRACLQHNMFLVSPSTNLRQIEVRAAERRVQLERASERAPSVG
jgi:predicted transcriptional regulator